MLKRREPRPRPCQSMANIAMILIVLSNTCTVCMELQARKALPSRSHRVTNYIFIRMRPYRPSRHEGQFSSVVRTGICLGMMESS